MSRRSPRQLPRRSPPKNKICNVQGDCFNGRKSPLTHAKEHRVGSVMVGLDGNMWKIKMITKRDGTRYKRWVKV